MHTDRKDIRFAVTKEKKKLTAVGFEPTRIAPPELESGALDRSAKLSGRQEKVKHFLEKK